MMWVFLPIFSLPICTFRSPWCGPKIFVKIRSVLLMLITGDISHKTQIFGTKPDRHFHQRTHCRPTHTANSVDTGDTTDLVIIATTLLNTTEAAHPTRNQYI